MLPAKWPSLLAPRRRPWTTALWFRIHLYSAQRRMPLPQSAKSVVSAARGGNLSFAEPMLAVGLRLPRKALKPRQSRHRQQTALARLPQQVCRKVFPQIRPTVSQFLQQARQRKQGPVGVRDSPVRINLVETRRNLTDVSQSRCEFAVSSGVLEPENCLLRTKFNLRPNWPTPSPVLCSERGQKPVMRQEPGPRASYLRGLSSRDF